MLRVRSFIVSALPVICPCTWAFADCFGMPSGARQYIEIGGNWASAGFCPNPPPVDCGNAASGTEALDAGPGENLVEPCVAEQQPGLFVFAESNNTANSMSLRHVSSASSVFHYNSMVDTFTITGPAGSEGSSVDFTVRCRMVGSLSVGPRAFDGLHVGGGTVEIEIGTAFSTATASDFNEQFRVTDIGTPAIASLPFSNYGASRPIQSFDQTRTQPFTRTAGTPFDLAFGFNCTGMVEIAGPSRDGRAVMTIDFDLPEGYSISSSRGWTDPDAPEPCPADLVAPFGVLDLADINAFIAGFLAQTPAGDLDGNGIWDLSDINIFTSTFVAGCP